MAITQSSCFLADIRRGGGGGENLDATGREKSFNSVRPHLYAILSY